MIYDWQAKTITLYNETVVPMCIAFHVDRGCIIKDQQGNRNILHLVRYNTRTHEVTVVAHDSKTGKVKRYPGNKLRLVTATVPTTVVPGICTKGSTCRTCNLVQQSILEELNNPVGANTDASNIILPFQKDQP